MRVGKGENKVDVIYIDNAVSAHLKACAALDVGNPLAGKVYFVSDGEPVKLWVWINDLLKRTGRPPITHNISHSAAFKLGHLLEVIYSFFGIKNELPMTRFIASQLSTSHYFNISRAKEDFGYEPVVSPEDGMNSLIQSLSVPQEY